MDPYPSAARGRQTAPRAIAAACAIHAAGHAPGHSQGIAYSPPVAIVSASRSSRPPLRDGLLSATTWAHRIFGAATGSTSRPEADAMRLRNCLKRGGRVSRRAKSLQKPGAQQEL